MINRNLLKLTNTKEYNNIFKRYPNIYEILFEILKKDICCISDLSKELKIEEKYIEILLEIWRNNRYTFHEYGRVFKLGNKKWKLLNHDDIMFDKSEEEINAIYN